MNQKLNDPLKYQDKHRINNLNTNQIPLNYSRFVLYSDNLQTIELLRSSDGKKNYSIIFEKNKQPEIISLRLPNKFELIPLDRVQLALSKHGKKLIKSSGKVVSIHLFPLLLGGGQVSSKVLSAEEKEVFNNKIKKSNEKINKSFTNEERIKQLNSQISDISNVLDEWKTKYTELEKEYQNKKVTKIVEVPVEIIKIVEREIPIQKNCDEKINDLQNQILNYEKRIIEWKNKFQDLNETIQYENSTQTNEESVKLYSNNNIKYEQEELEIEDESDTSKLKTIKEKIKSLQNFSQELQNKCITLESNPLTRTIEKPVEIIRYIDKPVEFITIDNTTVDNLRDKVQKLNEILLHWQERYSEYESRQLLRTQTSQEDASNNLTQDTNMIISDQTHAPPLEQVEEDDNLQVLKLKQELDTLRETLMTWQSSLMENETNMIEKISEVPIEVVRYVDRPIEIIKTDESKSRQLQSQINEIYTTIDEWKIKYHSVLDSMAQTSNTHTNPTYYNQVNVHHSHEEIQDERVTKLKNKIEELKQSLQIWESAYEEISNKEQKVIEKIVEVRVPVTKYIERPIEVIVKDETKVNELQAKIIEMNEKLTTLKSQTKKGERKKITVEKIVEVPVEIIKYVDRNVEKVSIDEDRIKYLTEHLNDLQDSLSEWERRINEFPQKEVKIVEKIVEVPVEIIKYIDKVVYVDQEDEERLNKVTEDYQKLQNSLAEWQYKFESLSQKETKIKEKIIEVPVEVIKYIDKPVEILVVDENRLNDLIKEYQHLQEELERVKSQINLKSAKKKKVIERIVEVPVERIEYIENEIEIIEVDEEKIRKLTTDCEKLEIKLTQLQKRYESLESRENIIKEKIIEIPYEVTEYMPYPRPRTSDSNSISTLNESNQLQLQNLQEEHDRLLREISNIANKLDQVSKNNAKNNNHRQKITEVPIEKIEYVDKIVEVVKVDKKKLHQLNAEYEELSVSLNNWKAKYEATKNKKQKKIKRIQETPIEVLDYVDNITTRVIVDEKRISELTEEYNQLTYHLEDLKEKCLHLQQRKPIFSNKIIEIPIEKIEYVDKVVEVLHVDEEKLEKLNKEISDLTLQHDLLTNKYLELNSNTVKVIEKRVEIPREILSYIDYEVEVTKVDENLVQHITAEIEDMKGAIRNWIDKYNKLQSQDLNIVNDIYEIPIEVVEYIDRDVEVVNVDNEAIEFMKDQFKSLKNLLKGIKDEIAAESDSPPPSTEKVVKVAKNVTLLLEREVEVIKTDQNKIKGLEIQMNQINKRLNICENACKDLEKLDIKVIEKVKEIPVEKIVFIDKEVQVLCIDQDRVDQLEERVRELENQLNEYERTKFNKNKTRNIVEKIITVEEPVEVVRNVERRVEVVKYNEEKFNEAVEEYNALLKELAIAKVKYLELENKVPIIVEKIVEVPIEKIEYVDRLIEVIKVDENLILDLTNELHSVQESLKYWKNKTAEVEKLHQRVIERYVDVPKETIEYVDRHTEVVKVDEERIKILNQQYEDYLQQLNKLKFEYSVMKKSEPIIIEKFIEVPFEVIEYVDKTIEVIRVDEDRIRELENEYNVLLQKLVDLNNSQSQYEEESDSAPVIKEKYVDKIIERIEYVDVIVEEVKEDTEKIQHLEEQISKYTSLIEAPVKKIRKFVKLPPVIVENKVEVPFEIIRYIDKEVEVIKRDELKENELEDKINLSKDRIKSLKEQYENISGMPDQIIKKIVEVPVEIIKYIDREVEVIKYDENKILNLEKGIMNFKTLLAKWADKYEGFELDEDSNIYVRANIPRKTDNDYITTYNRMSNNFAKDDETRLNELSNEISQWSSILAQISDKFRMFETAQTKIVEKIIEIPVEIIKFVDRPYEVIKTDDKRVRELEREILQLQKSIDDYSEMSLTLNTTSQTVIQSVSTTADKHDNRPKKVYRNDKNVLQLENQIQAIQDSVKLWKNKYKELSNSERKIVEKIVEVPVEVVKYVDKRIDTIRKDDSRVQNLEKELMSLAEQFHEWQSIFNNEDNEDAAGLGLSRYERHNLSNEELSLSIPAVTKQSTEYLEVLSKVNRFTEEFQTLRHNMEELNSMEKIIIGKVVEIPNEIAEYIEHQIEIPDIRPKSYLNDVENMLIKLEAWKQGIENKVKIASNTQVYENKINRYENIIDSSPILTRDFTVEKDLEDELLEIKDLIEEYEKKIIKVEKVQDEIIVKTIQVKKEIEKIIYRDVEILIKDESHEQFLEKLIQETISAINDRKSKLKMKKTSNEVETIEKIIKIPKEVVQNVTRTIELPRSNDSRVRQMESNYKKLEKQLEEIIEKCKYFSMNEFNVVEKIIKIPREVIKNISREVDYEKYDETPILNMMNQLNDLNHTLTEYRNELLKIEDLPEETVEKIIEVKKEIVKYEIKNVEVYAIDERPIHDLENRKAQLLSRIQSWEEKIKNLEKEEIKVIEQIIEIPVKKVIHKHRHLSLDEENQNQNTFYSNTINNLVTDINSFNKKLTDLKIKYNNYEHESEQAEEIIIEVPYFRQVENIIKRVIYDEKPITNMQQKISSLRNEINKYSEMFQKIQIEKEIPIEKIVEVKKEIKKLIIRNVEKVVVNEIPVKSLETDIQQQKQIVSEWEKKFYKLRNEVPPTIEKEILIEKEKIVKINRTVEAVKYDDRPIQKAIEKIDRLHAMIESQNNNIEKSKSRKTRTVEKIVQISKDITVYKARKREIIVYDDTVIKELEMIKEKLVDEFKQIISKVSSLEKERFNTVKRTIEVPKKLVKKINRDIQRPFYDNSELKEWEEKCQVLKTEIKNLSNLKLETVRRNNKIIEKVVEVPYEVITYQDHPIEVIKWDDAPIEILEKQIEKANQDLLRAETRKRELELRERIVEKVVEVPINKYQERIIEKIIWDDEIIHQLQNKIKFLVEKLNSTLSSGFNLAFNEIPTETVERIIKVPRQIVKYVESVNEVVVYDDSPVNEVYKQILSIQSEIQDWKSKTYRISKQKDRIIEKVISKEVEKIRYVDNTIEKIIFDEKPAKILQAKINSYRKDEQQLKKEYLIKVSQKEEIIEKIIYTERKVIKKVDRLKEVEIYDNTRIKEIENSIYNIKKDIKAYDNLIKKENKTEANVIEKIVKIPKEVKIYEERIVEHLVEDDSYIQELEEKIRNLNYRIKTNFNYNYRFSTKTKKKKPEIKEKIIEVMKEVVKKIERPVRLVKYDDTTPKQLEKKLAEVIDKYNSLPESEVEIIQEEGEVIEKTVEVPTKIYKTVERVIEKVKYDDKRIKRLEKESQDLQHALEDWTNRIEILIEEKNRVHEETIQIETEIVKYIERPIEIVKYVEGPASVLENELNSMKRNLELLIEQYNNLNNLDKQYVYKTIEVPYETIKYVDKEVEVMKMDNRKVLKLEQKLKKLKDIELEIKSEIEEAKSNKKTTLERVKNIEVEHIKYLDRPVKRLKIKEKLFEELEDNLSKANLELQEWKKKCEDLSDLSTIKEKIIEIPKEVIREVEYPVEIVKVNDDILRDLAYEVSNLKSTLAHLEVKHEILVEQQNEVIEKVVEVRTPVYKYVDREINVIKLDRQKLKMINDQIKSLKNDVHRQKEMMKYERNRKSNKPIKRNAQEEIIKYVNRPIEVLSINKKSVKDIEDRIQRAFHLLQQWRERYKEMQDYMFTPQEKIIEVPVEVKKFGVIRVDLLKPNEKDIEILTRQVKVLSDSIDDFKYKVNTVQKSLRQNIIKEKIVEIPEKRIAYVEIPTEIVKIDYISERELKNELKKLRAAVYSSMRSNY